MPPVWHAPSHGSGPGLPARPNLGSVTDEDELHAFDTGPGPPRGAFLIAYVAVVVSGLFGGAIGYGLVNVSSGGTDGRQGDRRDRRRGRSPRSASAWWRCWRCGRWPSGAAHPAAGTNDRPLR